MSAGVVTAGHPLHLLQGLTAALGWLAQAFDSVEVPQVATPGVGVHGEMLFDGRRIMMGQGNVEWHMASTLETLAATQGVFTCLGDVDAYDSRARASGAEIVDPPRDLSNGRTYTARDPEGHPWFFTTPPVASNLIA